MSTKVKTYLVVALGFSIMLFLTIAGDIAKADQGVFTIEGITCAQEYVSEWTMIRPDTELAFDHGLCDSPLELFVWVGMIYKKNAGSSAIIPYVELDGAIKVKMVTQTSIFIQNRSEDNIWIQVVAK